LPGGDRCPEQVGAAVDRRRGGAGPQVSTLFEKLAGSQSITGLVFEER
jgi:hypothetical protein